MKPTTAFSTEHLLARHDRRVNQHSTFPATDCSFQPQTDVTPGSAWRRPSDRSRHAFRRMMVEMLAKHERDEPLEISLFAFLTAIAAWPLVDLLIALAQTTNG